VGEALPSLSTDQIGAFVELSRQGQIRAAAAVLGITEQGVRNRLLALEARLGVELYRKQRGPRRTAVLTDQGRRFLPHALGFLERARDLCRTFEIQGAAHELRVAASQYLIRYVVIDVLRDFQKAAPDIHVRLSTMSERDVEETLRNDPEVALGVAAPYEPSRDLDYHELFAMSWSLLTPPRHPVLGTRRVRLAQLTEYPLIIYERGSTGRQHVLDAFHESGLSPRVTLETTSTETIVSMVEAGLGISIVPLLPSGAVTRGRRVGVCPLDAPIRHIHSGVLVRRGERPSAPSSRFLEFLRRRFATG
jgi:DNA-binding transcriptional LysR family regulator